MTAVVSPGVGAGRDPDPGPDPAPRPGEPEPSRRRRVVPLAIVLTTVPVVVAAAGVYAIVTHKFSPQPFRTTYQVPPAFNLRQGDCFNLDHNDASVSLLPCSSAHGAEVFATFTLPARPWPGVDVVQSEADAGCAARVSGYLGSALTPSSLSRNAIYPDPVTWQAGVRTVICTIGSADGGKTIGSFRQPATAGMNVPFPTS